MAITAIVLTWAGRQFEPSAALQAIGGFDWTIIVLAFALVVVDRVLMLRRWLLLIQPTTSLPQLELTRIFFVSSFVGSILPAGVGGDAARAWSVSRQTGHTGAAVASVVVDRWLGLLAVGTAGCVGVLTSMAALPDAARPLILVSTALLMTGGVVGLYADRLISTLFPAAVHRNAVGRAIVRVSDAIGHYRKHGTSLMQVAGLSLLVQANRILLAWVLGLGLGIALPFSYYWVFMPLNILVILLPLSLGGFGLPQGTMIWTLEPLGVSPTQAFLLSTLFVGIGIVGNLPGAWMYVGGRAPSERAERS
ncbi:MAG: lysylphosphatidylglycerol synthase transmembrane domain-containing protein [Acidimicrobiia bacterium]